MSEICTEEYMQGQNIRGKVKQKRRDQEHWRPGRREYIVRIFLNEDGNLSLDFKEA